jgi:predicted phosphodiesterase
MKRIVLLPDTQFDSHDKKLCAAFVDFIRDYQPDHLIQVGDLLDCKAPARWSRATVAEFEGTLQGELDACNDWLTEIRAVYDGPFDIKSGNHDERIDTYIRKNAPAFSSLTALKVENLLELDALLIGWHRGFIEVAPGWVVAHGHEGSLRHSAGATALALAKKIGKSVVCGHTHRAGIINESHGYGGKLQTLTGMEVGHAMDLRKASYLRAGSANWQQALGILRVDGRRVMPELVPVINGKFTVEGKTFG